MVNANLTRVEQDMKLVNNNTADAGQDRLKEEAEAEKLKGGSDDQVKIIENRLLKKQLRDKHYVLPGMLIQEIQQKHPPGDTQDSLCWPIRISTSSHFEHSYSPCSSSCPLPWQSDSQRSNK